MEDDGSAVVRTQSAKEPSELSDQGARYRVMGEIGRGGIGAVYRVRDVDLGRELALKMLLDRHLGNTDMTRRFVEEAQIGGQLQHPGIVPVHELGLLASAQPYFTMKLVRGQTLSVLLKKRKDPSEDRQRILGIFEQACQTVAYAHARGVLHRDLKPSNIMVGAFGEVQVMDWGLAKVLRENGEAEVDRAGRDRSRASAVSTVRSDSSDSDSMAGLVIGTLAYMSPEQARGEVDDLEERSDVFGLGAILCEILTGKPPYVAKVPEEIHEKAKKGQLEDALARLDASGADAQIVRLAKSCLAREREKRPPNAGVVAKELGEYLASFEERTRASELAAAEARVRAQEERKARRLTVALAGTILLAVCLGSGGYLWVEKGRRDRLEETRVAVDKALKKATMLQGRAEIAGKDDPSLWSKALAAARRAEALLEGREADVESIERAQSVIAQISNAESAARAELERGQRERAFLDRLEDVRIPRAEEVRDVDPRGMDLAYAAAFREFEVDVEQLDVDTAARRIRAHSNHVQLAAALDDWTGYRKQVSEDGDASWERLVALARAVDRDAWRDRLRANFLKTDFADLRNLALSAEKVDLPPVSWNLLGMFLGAAGDHEGSASVYREALRRYPGDFWLNFQMGVALEMLDAPDWQGAIGYYRAALALWPENARVWYRLGHSLSHVGMDAEALAAYRESIRLQPDFAIVHFSTGVVLSDNGDLDGAEASYKEAIRLRPDYAVAYSNLGHVLRRKGDSPGAIEKLKEAIRLQPAFFLSHMELAGALGEMGDSDGAIAEYREAIRLQPERVEAHTNLGTALTKRGDLDGAIASYREAVRVRPDDAKAHTYLGRALSRKGDLDGAIAEYREAIRVSPDDPEAHLSLGNALSQSGDTDGAIASYREAVRLNADFAEAHGNLGFVLARRGDLEGAVTHLREAIRLKPNFPEAHAELGIALTERGDLDGAIASLREAIDRRPEYAKAHTHLGNALRLKGDVDGAIASHKEAIRIAPESPRARVNMGMAFASKGDLEEGIAQFREAIRLNPRFADAHYNLGTVLAKKQDIDGAVASFREAIRLRPAHARAHTNLGNALSYKGKLAEAMASHREAIRLQPDLAEAHCNLGLTLRRTGDFKEALAALRKAHEIGSRRENWAFPSARWVRSLEKLVEASEKLDAVLSGEIEPEKADLLPLAKVCDQKGLYGTAARFYSAAGDRYHAASASARNGCGQGQESGDLDGEARAAQRRQALEWLRAELAVLATSLEQGGPVPRRQIPAALGYLSRDASLSCVREEAALANLPPEESQAWKAFWAEVDALRGRADGGS